MDKKKDSLDLTVPSNKAKLKELEPDISSAIFGMTVQNQPINTIFRVNSKRNSKKKPMHKLEIQYGAIRAVTTAPKLDAAAAQMFDYLLYVYANTPNHDNNDTVVITLSDYMRDFKKTDRRSARRAIKNNLDALFNTYYEYYGGYKDDKYNPQWRGYIHLLNYAYNRRGTFIVKWDSDFYNHFLVNHVMPMPHSKYNFTLDPHRDGTALYILRALEENKRKNAGNPSRQNWIKVSTLLEYVRSLKPAEQLRQKGDRHYYERIIEPIYKAVERLANPRDKERPLKSYCFTSGSGNNKKLLELGDKNVDYNLFINANLEVEWNSYPDNLLEQWSKTQRSKNKNKNKQKSKTK